MADNKLEVSNKHTESLIDYVLDVKPYHTKLSEVVEEYLFEDAVDVKVVDNDPNTMVVMGMDYTKSSSNPSRSVWSQAPIRPNSSLTADKHLTSDGNRRVFGVAPVLVNKLFSEHSAEKHTATAVPNEITGLGVEVFESRNFVGPAVPLVSVNGIPQTEGLGHHLSHGTYSFNTTGGSQWEQKNLIGINGLSSELGVIQYSDVKRAYGHIVNISCPASNDDYEEWTLIWIESQQHLRVIGSVSGFIGTAVFGVPFVNAKISFTFIAPPNEANEVPVSISDRDRFVLTPSPKICVHPTAPNETWSLIKVNPIALASEPTYHLTQPSPDPEPEPDLPGILFPDFDYMVITFSWAPSGGTDLDTRTGFIDTIPAFDGLYVGWSRLTSIPTGTTASDPTNLMRWGGDNTGSSGPEAVVVSFSNISANYPSLTNIKIGLRAYWYSTRGTGDFTVTFTTFKGGTMQASGYTFINVGGTEVATGSINGNVSTIRGDGDPCGTIVYNTVTKSARIYTADETIELQNPVPVEVYDDTVSSGGTETFLTSLTTVAENNPSISVYTRSLDRTPSTRFDVIFDNDNTFTLSSSTALPGYPKIGLDIDRPFKDEFIHFRINRNGNAFAPGNTFVIRVKQKKEHYLVHGSVSGWQAPAMVGDWYFNGKIGFKIPELQFFVFKNGVPIYDHATLIEQLAPIHRSAVPCKYTIKFAPQIDPALTLSGKVLNNIDGYKRGIELGEPWSDEYCSFRITDTTIVAGDELNIVLAPKRFYSVFFGGYDMPPYDVTPYDYGTGEIEFPYDLLQEYFPLYHSHGAVIIPGVQTGDSIVIDKVERDILRLRIDNKEYSQLGTENGWVPLEYRYLSSYGDEAVFPEYVSKIEAYSSASPQTKVFEVRQPKDALAVIEFDQSFFRSFIPSNENFTLRFYQSSTFNQLVRVKVSEKFRIADDIELVFEGGNENTAATGFAEGLTIAEFEPGPIAPITHLMMTFNGASGSTNFVDLSPQPKTITRARLYGGSPTSQIITYTSKFGGAAAEFLFENYLNVTPANGFEFGIGDFTVEFWARVTHGSPSPFFMNKMDSDGFRVSMLIMNIHQYSQNATLYSQAGSIQTTNNAFNSFSWNHFAASRKDGVLRFFVNGALIGAIADTTYYEPAYEVHLWSAALATGQGNLDDLRVIQGKALYTAAFTPTFYELKDADPATLWAWTYTQGTSIYASVLDGEIFHFEMDGLRPVRRLTDSSSTLIAFANYSVGDAVEGTPMPVQGGPFAIKYSQSSNGDYHIWVFDLRTMAPATKTYSYTPSSLSDAIRPAWSAYDPITEKICSISDNSSSRQNRITIVASPNDPTVLGVTTPTLDTFGTPLAFYNNIIYTVGTRAGITYLKRYSGTTGAFISETSSGALLGAQSLLIHVSALGIYALEATTLARGTNRRIWKITEQSWTLLSDKIDWGNELGSTRTFFANDEFCILGPHYTVSGAATYMKIAYQGDSEFSVYDPENDGQVLTRLTKLYIPEQHAQTGLYYDRAAIEYVITCTAYYPPYDALEIIPDNGPSFIIPPSLHPYDMIPEAFSDWAIRFQVDPMHVPFTVKFADADGLGFDLGLDMGGVGGSIVLPGNLTFINTQQFFNLIATIDAPAGPLVWDTFDGPAMVLDDWDSAILSGGLIKHHTSNSGHSWTWGWMGSNLGLDGNGNVYVDYMHYYWQEAWVDFELPTADYWIEVDFIKAEVQNTTSVPSFSILARLQPDSYQYGDIDSSHGLNGDNYVEVMYTPYDQWGIWVIDGVPTLTVPEDRRSSIEIGRFGDLTANEVFYFDNELSPGFHTFRLELQGTTGTVKIDGVTVYTFSTAGVYFGGKVGLRIYDNDEETEHLTITEYRADLLPSPLVLDTFSGSEALLGTRQGEIGAQWSAFPTPWWPTGGDITQYKIDGNGNLVVAGWGNRGSIAPSGALTAGPAHTIEMDFMYTGNAGPYTGFLASDGNKSYSMSWYMVEQTTPQIFEIDVFKQINGTTQNMGFFIADYEPNQMHTLRIVSTPTEKIFYLDGVEKLRFEDSALTIGTPWISLIDTAQDIDNETVPFFFVSRLEVKE
jgi:hypothetical protein